MTAASSDAKRRLAELLKARPELARMLLEQQVGHLPPIRPYPRRCGERARYHASWAQQRLWLIDRLEGGAAGYRIALVARILGPLDCKALQRALDALMERHESLRTTFVMEADGLRQEVGSAAGFPLEVLDLSGLGDGERSLRLRRQESDEIRRGFDLETGPLVRGCLVRLGCGEHVLLVTLHHIVGDGWSMGVFCRELAGLYSAFHQGRDNPLAPLAIQYADYARWQQELLRGDALQRQLAFWRESLAGMAGELKLPADRVRPAVQTYRGETLPVMLNPEVTAGLKRLAQRHDVTLFMVLHAAWAILLSRLSGQDDIVIGTPIANRQHPQLEGLIGFFANTLALRARIRPENRLDSLFAEIREGTLRAFAHQDVPFEKVVEAVRPERSLSRNPIFQVMLALQNAPGGELSLQDVKVELEDPVDEPAVFDLFLSLEERGKEIVGSLNFAADLFDRATVERWMRCFDTLLQGMTAAPDCRVGDLSIMPEGELRWVTKELNATGAVYPREKLVQELFEEQAHQCPESVAVEHEGRRLTYGELERRSNQVARYLVDQGLKPDQLVGLCMERGLEMVEGLLGILKAGGAYLPLDPTYPAERLRHMLADAAPQLVLTATELMEMLPATAEKAIKLAEERASIAGLPEESFSVGELGLSSESLVYVIYTSGSTGRPKGTAMRHRSMVNLIEWHRRTFGSSDGKRILQFAALSFDVAFQEIFSTLCTGGTLVLIDESARRDVQAMNALLRRDSIDRLFVPPLMLQSIAELVASSGEIPGDLKDVITAGEQLRVSPQIRELFRKMPGARLHNHYGPTETHVVTSLTLEGDPNVWPELPPVGRPIANTQIYVLDGLMRPVPIGVSGEVYIGGANVARGYLNRPDLTGQRFVADPFSADADARLYKTGDLGRWRADGMLEYLGRNDDQVKIRGFRIELGEVEAQLARHGQVKEAAVVVREDAPGQKRLVAYLVPRGEGAPGSEELRAHLKSALPDYMVPGAFVVLERLPLTPSGKLDRRALPAPDLSTYASHEYEPPRGEVEEVLAAIWQELLGLERVGRGESLHHVLSRHEALRTRIVLRDGMPQQEISGIVDLNLETDDLSSLRTSIRGQAVVDRLAEHVLEPVRLTSDPLLGCLLIREDELEYTLLLSMEHMISDALSMNILLRDIFSGYERLSRGVESVPAPPAIQFPEFARWLRCTQERRCQAHGRYWREHLLEREYTPFPRDLDLPLESVPAWDMAPIDIPGDLRIDLQEWSRQNRTTLVLCVLTAYIGLLSRWCNMARTVVQCLSDGRQSIESREAIGYFATPLFICVETPATITLPELLRLVVVEYCEAVDHADCSYLETLVPRPAFCRTCIFNWIPQGRNYDRDLRLQSSFNMICEPMAFGQPMLKRLGRDNDPGMTLFDTGQAITGGLYFPVCRFSYGTMDRFAKAFLTLLEEIPKRCNLRIESIAV